MLRGRIVLYQPPKIQPHPRCPRVQQWKKNMPPQSSSDQKDENDDTQEQTGTNENIPGLTSNIQQKIKTQKIKEVPALHHLLEVMFSRLPMHYIGVSQTIMLGHQYHHLGPMSSNGVNLNNQNHLVSQSNSPSYRSIGPFSNNEISQKQNSVNNAEGHSSPSFGSNVQSATNGLYRSQNNDYLRNPISSSGVNLNSQNSLVTQSNSPSYRSIGPFSNDKISQKQNSVNNAEGHSSPSFGSNVQSATNGLYRSQDNNYPGNPLSFTGVNINNDNSLVSQSNSPSYRSISPITNSEISQKQNSLNNAGGYSSPSFGSNVQSGTNGLYRSQTNNYPVNLISSDGINLNSQNSLVSQSNSPSYRSIGPIDNNEISQKQNSVNNAGGYSSPSFGSNVQSATNGLYRGITNESPRVTITSSGVNVNNKKDLLDKNQSNDLSDSTTNVDAEISNEENSSMGPSQDDEDPNLSNEENSANSNSPHDDSSSIGPIHNSEISHDQSSVNNVGDYSSPSFGSNVQSGTNGLYRRINNDNAGASITSTGINVNNQNDGSARQYYSSLSSGVNLNNQNSLVSQSNSPSYRSIGSIDNNEISQKQQNSVNNAGSQTNNYPGTPMSSTGINVNNQNDLVSQSNSPSYRSIGPIDNNEISQKQNSVNNAGGYSSPSFGSNVQSGTNGLYRSQTNNFLGNPSSSTGINVNNRNDLVSQSNSPSYRSIGPIDNNEISQKQNSVNNAGGYSTPSFGSNVQSATNGLYRSQRNNYPGTPMSSTGINVNNQNDLVSQSNSPSYRSIGPIDNNEISQKQNSVNNAGGYSSPSFGSNVQSGTNGLYRSITNDNAGASIISTGLNVNNQNEVVNQQNVPFYRSNFPNYNSETTQNQNLLNNAGNFLSPKYNNDVVSVSSGSARQYYSSLSSGVNLNNQNSLVSQSNSPSYRSIGPIDNSEISQKQNSVNNAGDYSSPSFGSNVQSATNGLYRSQTNNFPENPSSSTGINLNNRNDLVSQSNSPSYRSIGPMDNNEISQKSRTQLITLVTILHLLLEAIFSIKFTVISFNWSPIDNNEISQKQNSVNNAGGYSSPSFGSNVQSATNGLYRSQTNNFRGNPSSSTGINVNNRNDLVSQSNSPSYRSIRPIDNNEISQKQNSVNNAGGYSSPSFGSNVQTGSNGLLRSIHNNNLGATITSSGANVNNQNESVQQQNPEITNLPDGQNPSNGPIFNNEISQKQNSVNNADAYSTPSFGSNVQSATNGFEDRPFPTRYLHVQRTMDISISTDSLIDDPTAGRCPDPSSWPLLCMTM
ncbi:unnamed protein product [Lepeophtheirus salmonis]|uniref:(salmon louse) hypothetical protein n=2 Tax=Lepeophtheirus salmonis TaxID=72036 RepID=A0A7R8CP38_LEPSM|nr:unnamed protein product [Lepeophtheirus salmonis]CAF2882698.1 unnamed protein product [Lepeophtheirus salmonis]